MEIEKLSTAAVKTAKPGMHGDGGGLWLSVGRRGNKSWIFRFTSPIDGKPHEMGLGPLQTIGLADARIKALECRRQVLEGHDPLAAKRTAHRAAKLPAVKTFKQCADAFVAEFQKGWHNPVHRQQWANTLATYVFPVIGDMPVAAVDRPAVLRVITPLWNEKTETASRVRGRIEAILGWATQHGYREGDNPATWKGALEHALPKKSKVAPVKHHAALDYTEITAFVAELRQREGVAAQALQFAILTAARTGEVLGATWREIDLDKRLWTVPAARMKAGREHRVPLSEAAIAIIEKMAAVRAGDVVFPAAGGGRLSNMALLALLGRMGRGDLTAHGFRSTFSDWCAEETNTPTEVREMALAHAVSDKVEAAYRRGDLFEKRCQLAEAWSRFCTMPPAAVVPLRRARH